MITAAEVRALARVIDACDREVPVVLVTASGAEITGVIRHLYVAPGVDVRDAMVRISGTFEREISMRKAVELVEAGMLALDYRR